MTNSNCPPDDRLAALASGAVTGPEVEALEAHLDGCQPCRKLLAAVSNGSTPTMRPTDRPTLRPGELLGRYEIERLIGAGGMGMLYVARDPQLGRRVALKLMRPSLAAEGGRLRLLREAQAMAQLSHPNVVSVFDLGEVDGRVFVAMELLEGGTLRDWMRAPHSWKEVVAMFCEAGEGLAAAHAAGVVHRDFKPENVMMGKDQRPKVGDFGLARPELVAEEEPPLALALALKVTHAGSMLGTPAYMSPEQLAGKPADAKSDQYGFCVSLYEALAGQRPFPADSLEELRTRVAGGMPAPPKDGLVPAHVWAAIARGLNPNPAERFPDMQALMVVLRFPPAPPQRAKRFEWGSADARRIVATSSLAGVAVLVAVVASSLALNHPVRSLAPPTVVAPTPLAAPQASPEPPPDSREETVLTLKLAPGAQKMIVIPHLKRVAVGDVALLDASTIGTQQLLVVGKVPGTTTLMVWKDDGTVVHYDVSVEAPPRVIELKVNQTESLVASGIERVAIGDAEVANVTPEKGRGLAVRGLSVGKTTLLLWMADGTRTSYLVDVH